jgi:hypothetical protein
MPKPFHLHQFSSLTLCILLSVVSSCWLSLINQASGASSSPSVSTTTVCGKWASSFRGATRPTRMDASGFSITASNPRRQDRHLLPSSSPSPRRHHARSEQYGESTSSLSSSATATGSDSMIFHRHRGGAASARVKTMTARQMELFK